MARVSLTVNGVRYTEDVEPRLLLVHLIRDKLGLTGTHVGCDTSNCGACTVHLDGDAVKSCTRARRPGRRRARSRRSRASAPRATCTRCRRRSGSNHGLQCGYCTPGMIMAGADLLAKNPNPSEEEVREALAGNLCRCTGYHNIVKAVLDAASKGVPA